MQERNNSETNRSVRQIPALFYKIILPFLFIYLFICYYLGITRFQLSSDAGYYLSIARDMANGLILYKDIHCGYSPFAIIYFSFFFKLNINRYFK